VADSEASAIRTADLSPDGELQTIVGTGLFDFGDVDGQGDSVRLQHPLGVVFHQGQLYVADTYNSKIKRVDPVARESITFLGGNQAGWRDGRQALFDEPGGLSLGQDKLYIADTNNHVIRVADLQTGLVETLVLVDMAGLLTRQPAGAPYTGRTVTLEPQLVAAGPGRIQLSVLAPAGYKLNDLAPFTADWTSTGDQVQIPEEMASQRLIRPDFPLFIEATFQPGSGQITGELVIYYCDDEAQSLCFIDRVRLVVPVTVTNEGATTLMVSHEVPLPGVN
jgi:hypothetical protein